MFDYALLLLLCSNCLCIPRRPSKWHGRLSSSAGATLTAACAQATTTKDNPWAAILYFEDYFQCGATILENQLAITAAHCVNGLQIHDLTLYYGHSFQPDSGKENREGGHTRILAVRIHPEYDVYDKFEGYDIAVLKLARRIVFNDYVRPIKVVPTDTKYEVMYDRATFVKIAGLGQTKGPLGSNDPDDWPEQMQLVEHRIVPEQTCNRGNDTYHFGPPQDGLCTRNRCSRRKNPAVKAKYKQICKGDSGSGVINFFQEDNSYYLLAVVSYVVTHDQKECGLSSLPALSIKTRNHRKFIYNDNFEASPSASNKIDNSKEDVFERPTIAKVSDWSQWSSWSQCSRSCGEGSESRNRSCQLSSKVCRSSDGQLFSSKKQTRGCRNNNCPVFIITPQPAVESTLLPTARPTSTPVDGGWSGWSRCSRSCRGGAQSRTCKTPRPLGRTCQGPKTQGCNQNIICNGGRGRAAGTRSSTRNSGKGSERGEGVLASIGGLLDYYGLATCPPDHCQFGNQCCTLKFKTKCGDRSGFFIRISVSSCLRN